MDINEGKKRSSSTLSVVNKVLTPQEAQKEIEHLQEVYIKRQQYSVFLGNGSRTYYTALKDAKRFLAETNRFLNDRLHKLNYLYGNAFTEYRKIWFYFSGIQNSENKIIECFNEADRNFMIAVTRGNTINANAFVYNWVNDICSALTNALSIIKEFLRDKKYYADLRRIEMIERQVIDISMMIENYGK
jgi:CRISPR/Cas system-associated endoribonuclease Cas2